VNKNMPVLIIGQDENKFKKEITMDQYRNMLLEQSFLVEPASTYENTKVTISYQVNIFDIKETIETYYNISQAIIRLYNLKQIRIESANIFVIVRNGNKKIIIDDCIGCDLYYSLFNCNDEIKKIFIENESLKIENKLYKDFIKKFNAEKTFEDFKKEKNIL
jgi:hypothetical protein